MASANADNAAAIIKHGGVESLVSTVRRRNSSAAEVAATSRALTALATAANGTHAERIMGVNGGEVVAALAGQIADRGEILGLEPAKRAPAPGAGAGAGASASGGADDADAAGGGGGGGGVKLAAMAAGDGAYHRELRRRAGLGVATAAELDALRLHDAEIAARREEEAARGSASLAIMSLATSAENIAKISDGGGVDAVLGALSSNPGNRRHSIVALEFVATLAAEASFDTDKLVAAGGVEGVLATMSRHPDDAELLSRGLEALSCLASDEEHVLTMVGRGAVQLAVRALTQHASSSVLADAASGGAGAAQAAVLAEHALFLLSLLVLVEPGATALEQAAGVEAVADTLWALREDEKLLFGVGVGAAAG
eukprot:g3590.t1